MPVPIDMYGVGGGIPESPEGTLPIGAVDADPIRQPHLYELAKRRAQGHRPAAARRSQEDVLASLISKATPGTAMPGEGMVPFGDLPPELQNLAGKAHGQPLVGFDPTKLDTQERYMLEQLRRKTQQQVAQRVDNNPQYASQMPPGGGAM